MTPALSSSAIRALRNRFGDLAGPIMALRDAGRTVRPFGDRFAVDEVVVDVDELERMAARIADRKAKRTKPKPAPDTPAGEGAGTPESTRAGSALANHSIPRSPAQDAAGPIPTVEPVVAGERGTATCPCGRARGHGGRCWHMRGYPCPTLKRAQPRGGICAGCAGPLSRSAAGDLCRKCVLEKVRKSSGIPARVAALEAQLAAFKDIVRAAVAELLERIDNMTSEGR